MAQLIVRNLDEDLVRLLAGEVDQYVPIEKYVLSHQYR